MVRQLSGYGRDLPVLKCLGYDTLDEGCPTPAVPCVIVYPEEDGAAANPFLNVNLRNLCRHPLPKLSMFYKIVVPVPRANA